MKVCIPSEEFGGYGQTGKTVLHISSIANAAKFNNLFQSAMSCSLADGGLDASNTDQGQDQQPSFDL